jgi:hypothetical protein
MADNNDSNQPDEAEDQRPWNEEQWERALKESDLRAARFGELLETLIDHPDRDEIVAREMGWDDLADAIEEEKEHGADGEDEIADDELSDDAGAGEQTPAPQESVFDIEAEDEHDLELKQIPAYLICDEAAEAVRELLLPFQKEDRPLDEDAGDAVGQAFIGIHIACAKISGGHAMGYDEDALCGNIVNNKRALAGARQSIDGFQELLKLKVLDRAAVEKIMPKLKEAEAAIEARIAELRAQVWWD